MNTQKTGWWQKTFSQTPHNHPCTFRELTRYGQDGSYFGFGWRWQKEKEFPYGQ